MRMKSVSIHEAYAFVGGVSLLLWSACAPREMARTPRGPAEGGESATAKRAVEVSRDTAGAPGVSYDIEDEMPEKTPQRPAQLIERIEPARPDSVSVTDVAVEEAPKQRYDVGYRIQVFATGDRAAAEKIKERIVAETAMSAYIDYEDGLYKVRAGDFAERKDAAQARLKLAGAYPGSWIVRTTVRR